MSVVPDPARRRRNRFQLQLVLAAAACLVILGWIGVDSYGDYRSVEDSLSIELQSQAIGERLLDYEEVMTMSVRLAAASGDAKWERRYNEYEPRLDESIRQARRLQHDTQLGTAGERIDSANNALVNMQHRALELVRQGKRDVAEQLLSSDQHEAQRERYAQGMREFNANLWRSDRHVRDTLVAGVRRDVITTGVAALLLILLTLFAFRVTRRWEATLVETNQQLSAKTSELQEFNSRLDRKVAERTRDLEEAAIASLNMMEDAIRQREKADRTHKELDYLSSYDPLTGLANRRLLMDRVTEYLRVNAGDGHKLALFLIDIERFKNINDSLGVPLGDEMLRQTARWFERHIGRADRLARVGADHFAIVLPVVASEDEAAQLLETTLADLMEQPFALNESVFRIAAKAGAAMFPSDGSDADQLFRHAEAALKRAKTTSERYLFYTRAMTEMVAGKLTMENQLRSALDNEEFVLHYQPKVSLTTNQLTGVEALIRWNDPRKGLVPPGMFIPILEETGLIHEVGRWAMRQAIRDYLRWRDMGLRVVRVAVNVSALQLRSRDFLTEIEQTLGMGELAVEGLEVELTESMIMEDVKQSISTLQAIRGMGVRIAIDDFGTGFSSLGYLAKLPIDVLKIDRSFVTVMVDDPQGLSLVTTIINLAHSLELKVVAEGVETEEQARVLRLLRADEMQGYLFSKPVPSEILERKFLTETTPETN